MPRFTFVIQDTSTPSQEPIVADLETADEARQEAIATLAGLAKDILPDGDQHDFNATVMDSTGRPIFEAKLSLRSRWLSKSG